MNLVLMKADLSLIRSIFAHLKRPFSGRTMAHRLQECATKGVFALYLSTAAIWFILAGTWALPILLAFGLSRWLAGEYRFVDYYEAAGPTDLAFYAQVLEGTRKKNTAGSMGHTISRMI